MRIPALAIVFCLCTPLLAQVPDPGASQDEEAAREKILKAADQIDLMEGNAEATKTSVDGMKADITKLEDENTALRQQLTTLQADFQKSEDDRAKERQILLDEVSKLVASKTAETHASHKHEEEHTAKQDASLAPPPDAPTAGTTAPANDAETADSGASTTSAGEASSADTTPAPAPAPAPPPKPRKGYSYTVGEGQTLTMICAAYRSEGVPVTVAEVRKANGLTEKSVLKTGQKLFIPKPGT